jgi:hypothetical protein
MAAGDLTLFEEYTLANNNGVHDLDTDVLKCGFTSDTPTAADVTPTWGDYTAENGGNFPSTPDTVTGTLSEVGGVTTFDLTTNLSYASNPSNPTDIKYAVLYNSSKSDQGIGFVEIAAAGANGTAGLISLTWGANVHTTSIV